MNIKPVDGDTLEFSYADMKGDAVQSTVAIKVDSSELLVMQKMIEVSLYREV